MEEQVDRRDTQRIKSEEKGRLASTLTEEIDQAGKNDQEEAAEKVRTIAEYYFSIMGTNPQERVKKNEMRARRELSGDVLEALRQGGTSEEQIANVRKVVEPLIEQPSSDDTIH